MNKNCCSSNNKNIKTNKPDSFLIGIIIVTFLLLGGVIYFGSKMGATTQIVASTQMKTVIDSNQYDWGNIDMDNGIVSKTFTIKNESNTALKLYDVKTSCMCTTAQLKTNTQSSKKFGMHEKTTNVFEVGPNETANLIVEFDPAFHGPSAIGPISRTVTMNTNDANHSVLSFQLAANVFKK